jgi:hypothetical protein
MTTPMADDLALGHGIIKFNLKIDSIHNSSLEIYLILHNVLVTNETTLPIELLDI